MRLAQLLAFGGPGIDANYSGATTGVTANSRSAPPSARHRHPPRHREPHTIGLQRQARWERGDQCFERWSRHDGLWGQGNNDSILGAGGNDTIGGGQGNDRVNGGAGSDIVHFGQAPAVTVNLATGSATGEGTDVLSLFEQVVGSSGADKITGTTGVNMLQGAGGNDTLLGHCGNDKLYGAGGNDSLTGGTGTDTCDGGTETDTATTCETRVSIP